VARACKKCGDKFEAHGKHRRPNYCLPCAKSMHRATVDNYQKKYPERVKANQDKQNKKARQDPKKVKKQQEACRAYYAANKEKSRDRNRQWVADNKDRYRESLKAYRGKRDREYFLEMGRRSYEKNRDKISKSRKQARKEGRYAKFSILRRGRIRHALGKTSRRQLEQKLEYYGHKCWYCYVDLTDENLSFDHAIPVARGGTSWTANFLPACRKCNSKKGNKTVFEYLKRCA
jgi:5-methylcytosine-specific restriction endonuclease McrA